MLEGIMRAVVLNGVTKAEDVEISNAPIPEAKSGWVVIKIKAFGLNHSEQILRLDEIRADYINKPIIPGIECVGEVYNPADTHFKKGQRVVAFMGGLGRSFDGSYAEYACIPAKNVFTVNSSLPWEKLAQIPETFFTAWGSLFECLALKPCDKLLVRGATCALGYAAIQLAKALGCSVIATTHKTEKLELLKNIGADECVLDDGRLYKQIKVTKALDLVGPKTLRDTLFCVERGGIVCDTGILGGVYTLNNFDPIKEIPNGVYLTGFFSNYPTQAIVDEMFDFIESKKIMPEYGKSYPFSQIKDALCDMDGGKVNGKIVIYID
jgi:NADPH:quinone reductase-like Zn-dependent oxidoreductase